MSDRADSKFPCSFYVYETHHDGNGGFWKLVGTIYDNEALGLLERLFNKAGLETKIG